MIRPSNSGTATCVATSSGLMPSSLARHCARETGQAQPLQDRDVQRGELRDVPGVVVAARADRRRRRRHRPPAPSSPSRRRCRGARAGRAPACAATRSTRAPAAACGLDRAAQRLDVGGVARQVLGAVEEDRDARAVVGGVRLRRSSTPQRGVASGGAKPKPVISRVSLRKACSWRRLSRRPGPGRRVPAGRPPRAPSSGSSDRRRATAPR